MVIDVLRAFSTAAYAMSLGAERIVLAASLDQARALQVRTPGSLTLADGARVEGVDLVNSPALLADVPLRGRTVIVKTTNGTVAALAARDADPLLCASFVNAPATAAYLRARVVSAVSYVASGGADATEDIACAHYLDALVADPETPAQPYLDEAARSSARALLDRRAAAGDTGVHPRDVELCLRAGAADVCLLGRHVDGAVVLTAA